MIQGNVKNILSSICEWSSTPMYKRKDCNRNMCLDILKAQKQMKIQSDRIQNTKELIQRGMQENFNLFFNAACVADEIESNNKTVNCNHNVTRRMELLRVNGKSSDDLGSKVRRKMFVYIIILAYIFKLDEKTNSSNPKPIVHY